MENFLPKKPPPPVVLVPPLFDFPPLSARTWFLLHSVPDSLYFQNRKISCRMLESSYDLLFGKLALKCLFDDYFEEARQFSAKILLKPIDDPHVDLVASVSGSLDRKVEGAVVENALFRWRRDIDDPHTFVDISVSTSNPVLLMRSSAYYPKYGVGAFAVYPLLSKKTLWKSGIEIWLSEFFSRSYCWFLVYTVEFLNSGTDEMPKTAWLVSKMGRFTVGVQYEPLFK